MNFWVAKMYGIMTHSMGIQKYNNSIHKALPKFEATFTGN